ncbi:hypothetical protein [Levilactobacillus sp. N40-8-2]|uniref:hypothetical protein n=1 Tax=Levilactobacillus muriae TaxID=3238987 RepID=UPI0038B3A9C1
MSALLREIFVAEGRQITQKFKQMAMASALLMRLEMGAVIIREVFADHLRNKDFFMTVVQRTDPFWIPSVAQ